ncbi:E3 ubiquitin-protein ligase DCST1-like [Ambystoma mexicanum]|uniref:E3 ubiquitin-protein ligase DCST1-like n=1 Tax=Ambystoma mexicanum TaxID=8296 RepID=UPI0037E9C29C
MGVGFFFLIIDPLALNEPRKMGLLGALFGEFIICVLGWALSPIFRCVCFLILPQVLGKEGRTYLLIYVVSTIYAGPIWNIENNLDHVVESIGCTVEQQINHTKMMWKVMIAPMKSIVENLVQQSKELNKDTKKIETFFEPVREQIMSREGLDEEKENKEEAKELEKMQEREKEKEKGEGKGNGNEQEVMKEKEPEIENQKEGEAAEVGKPMQRNIKQKLKKALSTQKLFEIKTMLRCEYVADKAEERCRTWFDAKHEKCMRTIWVPILNHLLCLPMTFKFLCKLVHLMTHWCKAKIPLEGNFGNTFDNVNSIVTNLSNSFEAEMTMKKTEQSMIPGVNIATPMMMEEVKADVIEQKSRLNKIIMLIQTIMSLLVLLIFISAFSYVVKYNTDIVFDNFYITTYFKQIDARRYKAGKRILLPLKKGEAVDYVFPFQIRIARMELKKMIIELFHCVPIFLFLIAVCIIDYLLTVILQIIRKHAAIELTFKSQHKIDVIIGGDGMMANLLRKTIGALSSSSNTEMKSDNTRCLPNPDPMEAWAYFLVTWPILFLVFFCIMQVYMCRIRRAVAAFFYPKREKQRIIFLYNEMLRKRTFYINIQKAKIWKRARREKLTMFYVSSVEKLNDHIGDAAAGSVSLVSHKSPVLGDFEGFLREFGKMFDRRKVSQERSGFVFRTFNRCCPCLRWCCRRKCIVCNASQNKKSVICQNKDCETVYCYVCWLDLGKVCYACLPQQREMFISGDREG